MKFQSTFCGLVLASLLCLFPAFGHAFSDTYDMSYTGTYPRLTGETDDGPRIQRAVTAAHNANGGIIYFPNITYTVHEPITLYSDITLQGAHQGYGGACNIVFKYIPDPTNPDPAKRYDYFPNGQYLFKMARGVAGGIHRVAFRDLEFSAIVPTPGQSTTNSSIAVDFEGVFGTDASDSNFTFENCTFHGFNKAINIDGSSVTGEWQCDHIMFNHCNFSDNNVGIYCNTQNADYVQVLNCGFSIPTSCYGIYLQRSGIWTIQSTAAGGSNNPSDTVSSFIYTGLSGNLTMIGNQAESVKYFFYHSSAPDTYGNIYTFIGNVINPLVKFMTTTTAHFEGNYFTSNVVCDPAAYMHITSANDYFDLSTATPHVQTKFDLGGHSYVMTKSGSDGVKSYLSLSNEKGFPVTKEEQPVTTSADIITAKADPAGNYRFDVYIRVATAAANVTLDIKYTDASGTQQTFNLVNNASLAVGGHPYTVTVNVPIAAWASDLKVTAAKNSGSGNVYLSGSITNAF